jgi:hypothetical protein
MKNYKVFILFSLAAALCLGSCSKTGPAGPQGEQGQKGPQGETGAAGIAGADGSTIYSGNELPSTAVGQQGDYYIDLATSKLYGPKTDQGWGDPLNLKGAQGETGPQGPKGDKGDQGDTGPKGDKGDQGDTGPKGDKGDQGDTGPKGDKGDQGDTGPKGDKGDQGDPGQNGKDGSQILSGTSVPASSAGNIGDYYWNTSNYTLYGPKTTSGWGTGIVLRGPKGDKGDPGTANVMYSDWLAFTWSTTYSDRDIMYIQEPKVTLSFINNGGTILSYLLFLQTQDEDTITAAMYFIPEAVASNAIGYAAGKTFNLKAVYYAYYNSSSTNMVYDFTTADGSTLPSNFLQDRLYVTFPDIYNRYRVRYMLIPGGIHLRRSSPPPDPKNYKATCEYYGIPE